MISRPIKDGEVSLDGLFDGTPPLGRVHGKGGGWLPTQARSGTTPLLTAPEAPTRTITLRSTAVDAATPHQ